MKDGAVVSAVLAGASGTRHAFLTARHAVRRDGGEPVFTDAASLDRLMGGRLHLLVTPRQVHSASVLVVDDASDAGRAALSGAEADAVVTALPGVPVGVLTADCLPLLLYDRTKRVVAAVHAGWRGVAKGVVAAALATMEEVFSSRPSSILAALGPAIGPCCFEVGSDVAAAFGEAGLGPRFFSPAGRSGRFMCDLAGAVSDRLAGAGVSGGAISVERRCTCCGRDFFSHRRDGAAMRQLSFIMIDP